MSLCGDRRNCLFPLLGPLSCVISWTGHLGVMLFLERSNERNHSSVLQEVTVMLFTADSTVCQQVRGQYQFHATAGCLI